MSATLGQTTPVDDYTALMEALAAASALRSRITGRRVRFVGMLGNAADQPEGRIKSVAAGGFTVRWDEGRTEQVHPDSLVFI